MARRFSHTMTTASAIAVTAVVTSAISATASGLITSAQIKDKTIQARDIADRTISNRLMANSSINNRTLANGSVTANKIAPNVLYRPVAAGLVKADGTIAIQQGSFSVTPGSAGFYCINVPGLNMTQHVITLNPDWRSDSTTVGNTSTIVEANSDPSACGTNGYSINTYKSTDGSGNVRTNEPFYFVIH